MAIPLIESMMGKQTILSQYQETFAIEREDPETALATYTEALMLTKPISSADYDMWVTLEMIFTVGAVLGFIMTLTSLGGKNVFMALFSLIFGALFFGAFLAAIVWMIMRVHQDTSKLSTAPKFWVTILAYMGASRCSIRLRQPDDAVWYAQQLKKFDLVVVNHLADGLIALAHGDWGRAEYVLSIAAHMAPPGKFQKRMSDAIYAVVMLHPERENVIRRDAGAYHPQDYKVQHVHGDVVYGQTNIDISDSVINRSEIGSSRNRRNEDR